ncbi:chromosome partitioning protein ParB [Chryseotalea sanaruensis]|uniref:Chromosome partitioning protein ParB n=1 Tax=Chryseotalea sanaruensis TaxID=2482724 RepID=A0A401U5G9_9BACT|nr:ParB/RepB/Spo0J family partition protein [Chryseotalea sanaruensis]GCC50204.1 chromosome partitioning protein ParB [Chryseotalea sanaruensis]
MSKKKALGRGLNALLSDNDTTDRLEAEMAVANVAPPSSPRSGINEILISEIETNPFQPRTHFDEDALLELAESIKVHGIIQPITVRRLAHNQYQLISGERRFQASKLAGLEMIPAYIRAADDQQMLEMALIENIQRENLNAIEIALSYQRLLTECNLKQEQLGERVGKNRATVTNYLRLLKLPPDIQIAVRDNRITMGHARAIINVDSADQQLYIFKKTLAEELSVRKVEELVREMSGAKTESAPAQIQAGGSAAAKEMSQLQSKLSSHFSTRVMVKSDGRKGEIKIPFVSVEDLNRILDILRVS